MKARLTIKDIPELPGWLSVAAIAEQYGINKGTVYHMIYESRTLATVFKVAKGGSDQRPMLLVAENEVRKAFDGRQVVADPDLTKKVGVWNKRVKDWGRAIGWDQTPIFVSGPPPIPLTEAYIKEHPDDVRPGSQ